MNRLERYFRVKEDYFMDRILDATDFIQDYSHPLTHSIVQQTDPEPFSVGYKKLNILFQYHISTTTPFIWMASDQWGMVPRVTGWLSFYGTGKLRQQKEFFLSIHIHTHGPPVNHSLTLNWIDTHTGPHSVFHPRTITTPRGSSFCLFSVTIPLPKSFHWKTSQSMSPNACFLPTPYAYCRLKLTRCVSFIAAHTTFMSLAFTFLFTPRRTEDCSTTSSSLLPQLRAD